MSKNTNWEKEFSEKFGELSGEQLWLLTKFAKNVRLRCRNNTAFNNFMNSTFKNATFRQVTKTRKNYRTGLEESYQGLHIEMKNGTTVSEEEGED